MISAIIAAIGLPTLLSGVGGGLVINLIRMLPTLSKAGSVVSNIVHAIDKNAPVTQTVVANPATPIQLPNGQTVVPQQAAPVGTVVYQTPQGTVAPMPKPAGVVTG